MSEIIVKSAAMTACAGKEMDIAKRLSVLSNDIESVRKGLSFNIRTRAQIDSNLIKLSNTTGKVSEKTKLLSKTLTNAVSAYSATENKVSKNVTGVSSTAKNKSSGGSSSKNASGDGESNKSGFDWKTFWKGLSNFGVVGSTISTIGSIKTGGHTPGDILKDIKYGVSTIEKIAGAIPTSNAAFDWKKLFGFNKSSKTLGEAFYDKFIGDYNFGKATSVSEKVKVGAKWVGTILTVLTTGYENFTDKKENNSFGRKLAETVSESAINIGITAGFGAIAAAVGAPAIVGGLAAVGVVWAADLITEKLVGKKSVEALSDLILDGGEKLVNGAKNVAKNIGKSVGNAAKTAGNKISGWWNGLWGK